MGVPRMAARQVVEAGIVDEVERDLAGESHVLQPGAECNIL
jgi:hypothetical protein